MSGQDIRDANHDDAARAFKLAGSKVELLVQYDPVEFHLFQVHCQLAHVHACTCSSFTTLINVYGENPLHVHVYAAQYMYMYVCMCDVYTCRCVCMYV